MIAQSTALSPTLGSRGGSAPSGSGQAESSEPDTILICPGFFGYAKEMKHRLERRGRSVAVFEDRPATDDVTKALIRLFPRLMHRCANAYFDTIAAQFRSKPIRDVLVVKGEALSPTAVRRMRTVFPAANFTLYFWDSYSNMPVDSREKVALFDRAFSFDPNDVRMDHRLIYRPLFYLDEYVALPTATQDIDVLFFGTVHGDRYTIVKRIERALPASLRFEKVLYFPAPWLYSLRKAFDPAFRSAEKREFIFEPKGKSEIMNLIARARIILDIERPVQKGYTMRTLEVVGAGKKLITTNPEIVNADFFNPVNIAIVDRERPQISDTFLDAPYVPPAPAIVGRYSLDSWLDDILPDGR